MERVKGARAGVKHSLFGSRNTLISEVNSSVQRALVNFFSIDSIALRTLPYKLSQEQEWHCRHARASRTLTDRDNAILTPNDLDRVRGIFLTTRSGTLGGWCG